MKTRKQICFLFTSEFPYSSGEPFLETEIEYLASQFDLVYLFPIFALKASARRSLPKNCVVFPTSIRKSDLLSGALGLLSLSRFADGKDKREKGIRQFVNRAVFIGRARQYYKKLKKVYPSLSLANANLHFYSYWNNYLCAGGILFKGFLERKGHSVHSFVSRAHGCDVYSERKGYCGPLPLQRYNIERISRLFVCSRQGTAYVAQKFPDLAKKIDTAYLGVPPRKVLSASLDSKTFLTVAYFFPVKRMALFAKAFCIFAKKNPGWRWVSIGGKGPDYPEVLSIVSSQGAEGKVEFLGALTNPDVMGFYESHRVSYLVSSSSSEGIPVSMMEAESYGVPCIGPRVGGIPEIIVPGSGMVYEPDISPENLATLLGELSKLDKASYEKMSHQALIAWQTHFNAEKNYSVFSRMMVENND